MFFMTLFEIYNKINACPRKMGALQLLCALGDDHRQGRQWVAVSDMILSEKVDASNVHKTINQMIDNQMIERRYLDKEGNISDRKTRVPVIRLVPDCLAALGQGEQHVQI
ncbi:hypothetical protein K5N55_003890 [Vibrio vulnificus]|nr:hypothetical protein [Vibrio vulnificus]HAS6231100.1 hypothetical protein [Vibrio vulnificus]